MGGVAVWGEGGVLRDFREIVFEFALGSVAPVRGVKIAIGDQEPVVFKRAQSGAELVRGGRFTEKDFLGGEWEGE